MVKETKKVKKDTLRLSDIVLIIIVIIALGTMFLGCVGETSENVKEIATSDCIKLCQEALGKGEDLSNGPCLSNEVQADWVCDVAHSPRINVDNDPSNQCSAYENTAHHFIEVTPTCKFIRAI